MAVQSGLLKQIVGFEEVSTVQDKYGYETNTYSLLHNVRCKVTQNKGSRDIENDIVNFNCEITVEARYLNWLTENFRLDYDNRKWRIVFFYRDKSKNYTKIICEQIQD